MGPEWLRGAVSLSSRALNWMYQDCLGRCHVRCICLRLEYLLSACGNGRDVPFFCKATLPPQLLCTASFASLPPKVTRGKARLFFPSQAYKVHNIYRCLQESKKTRQNLHWEQRHSLVKSGLHSRVGVLVNRSQSTYPQHSTVHVIKQDQSRIP